MAYSREEKKQANRDWYLQHRQEKRERTREYYRKNRINILEKARKNRAAAKKAIELLGFVLKRDLGIDT